MSIFRNKIRSIQCFLRKKISKSLQLLFIEYIFAEKIREMRKLMLVWRTKTGNKTGLLWLSPPTIKIKRKDSLECESFKLPLVSAGKIEAFVAAGRAPDRTFSPTKATFCILNREIPLRRKNAFAERLFFFVIGYRRISGRLWVGAAYKSRIRLGAHAPLPTDKQT